MSALFSVSAGTFAAGETVTFSCYPNADLDPGGFFFPVGSPTDNSWQGWLVDGDGVEYPLSSGAAVTPNDEWSITFDLPAVLPAGTYSLRLGNPEDFSPGAGYAWVFDDDAIYQWVPANIGNYPVRASADATYPIDWGATYPLSGATVMLAETVAAAAAPMEVFVASSPVFAGEVLTLTCPASADVPGGAFFDPGTDTYRAWLIASDGTVYNLSGAAFVSPSSATQIAFSVPGGVPAGTYRVAIASAADQFGGTFAGDTASIAGVPTDIDAHFPLQPLVRMPLVTIEVSTPDEVVIGELGEDVTPEDHLIVHRPDYADRGVDLLLRQDRQKPRIQAFVRAIAEGVQLLEATCWAVIAGGALDAAEGKTLDRWGAIVGEVRGGLTHEEYRTFIELRARVNTLFPSEDMMWGLLDAAFAPFGEVARYLVSDGIVWTVTLPEMPGDALTEHAAGLIRDARPIGFYSPVIVETPDSFGWTSEFGDGSPFAEMIFDGRSRSSA